MSRKSAKAYSVSFRSSDTTTSPRHFTSRVPSAAGHRRECRVSAEMSFLTLAPLAARVSSHSGLEPRLGDSRNIAPRGRGLRNNAFRRVSNPSSRRTATVTPRASAMSAPEFAPGGKSAHLTALPPLRSWARARAPTNAAEAAR